MWSIFWEGLREHRVLIQRCTSCDRLRHPPRPMCPGCNSFEWDTVTSEGFGRIAVVDRHHAATNPAAWFHE